MSRVPGRRLADVLGLRYALIALARRWEKGSDLKIDLQVVDPVVKISPELRSALYKIVSDALSSIAGRASRARISLKQSGANLLLKITSDAESAGTTALNAAELAGIRERANSLGGTFYLGATTRRGSQLIVKLPLKSGLKH